MDIKDDIVTFWEHELLVKQVNEDLDYALALSLQTQYEDEEKENTDTNSKNDTLLLNETSSPLEVYSDDQKSEAISAKEEEYFRRIDEDLDYAIAVSLQDLYQEEVKENKDIISKKSLPKETKPLSIVDEQWELIDPNPDIHALFLEFDKQFFYGKLKSVVVKWSTRMTLCAGVCYYQNRAGYCSISLSLPLLKLRPRKDLVETLLHEMIHAYLFVTHNNKDREGHGPEFLRHMSRINKEGGCNITVYHNFNDEVELYRKHWWKCDGPCQKRPPFFGIVRRAMNRPPGPNDNWWADHQAKCGGKFIKIKGQDDNKKKLSKRKLSFVDGKGSDIRNFFNITATTSNTGISNPLSSPNIFDLKSILSQKETDAAASHSKTSVNKNDFIPFQGIGNKVGGSSPSFISSDRDSVSKIQGWDWSAIPSTSSGIVEAKIPKIDKPPRLKNNGIGIKVGGSSPSIVYSDRDSASEMKDWDWTAVPSTSSGIVGANFPKIDQPQRLKNNVSVPKDSDPKGQFTVPNKLVQSPIERFLTSQAGSGCEQQNRNLSDVCQKKELDTSKMYCPVCFVELYTAGDVDFHMVKCLLN